jgi:hypothetical protein
MHSKLKEIVNKEKRVFSISANSSLFEAAQKNG